jgi:hypothetical protein
MIATDGRETGSWNPDPFTGFVEDALKMLQKNTWSIFDSVKNSDTQLSLAHFNFTRMRYWRTVHETRSDVVIYPLTQADDQLCLGIHKYINIVKMTEIKQVLEEYGMDKSGRKSDLTQRLTTKLMILRHIPGRETFDRVCQTIDQLFSLSFYSRSQPDYPFKLNSAFHHDMNVPFESLVEVSRNVGCIYRLHDCFKHLRDMTPAISCSLAYGRWTTFTLSNMVVRAGVSWKIAFTSSKPGIGPDYRYDIKINGKQVLLVFTKP